jgi:DNA-binding transcriptional MerR regulator
MFKIGDFAKIARVPVKTLRYYDSLGLLRPVEVDPFSGYRYYAADQLPLLNRILALKGLGFSLDQIRLLLARSLSLDELRGMLLSRRAEIEKHVNAEHERLLRVEARLKLIEQEGKMPDYEITIKNLPPVRVASVQGILPTYAQQGQLWGVLESELARQRQKPAGPCFTRYLDSEYKERNISAEVCEPVGPSAVSKGGVTVYDLPAETMACIVHHGSLNTLSGAYAVLMKWIDENGYRITGPEREHYIYVGNGGVRQDDEFYITEVQFPVTRKQG